MAVIDNSTQRKFTITLRAGIVNEIVFPDTKPNHVHINNYGSAKLYFAMSNIPSSTSYDMIVYPYKADIFGQDTTVDRIRIYVDSTTDCRVEITSYYAPFDPIILNKPNEVAITQVDGTVSTTLEGFNAPLPAGTNNIGSVSVSNIPHVVVDTMPEISATVESVTISNVTLDSGTNSIGYVGLNEGSNVIGYVKIESSNAFVSKSGVAESQGTTFTCDIQRIVCISNDGENYDLKIMVNGDTENIFHIKPGESLNDIPVKCQSITLSCDANETTAYRFLGV